MDDQKRLRALEEAAGRGRRSPLFLWMYRHHETFGAMLRRVGKPNWKALAAAFTSDGLFPEDQKHETVRHTWLAVRKAIERETKRSAPLQQSAAQPRDEISSDDPAAASEWDFSDIDRALGVKPK